MRIKILFIIFVISAAFSVLIYSDLFAVLNIQEEEALQQMEIPREMPENDEEKPVFDRPKLEYNAYNLKDPFEDFLMRQKQKEEASKQVGGEQGLRALDNLNVKGVIWGGLIPQAIINDKVVKVGDVIEGAEIIDISKEGVMLIFNKRMYKLASPASGSKPKTDNIDNTNNQEVME